MRLPLGREAHRGADIFDYLLGGGAGAENAGHAQIEQLGYIFVWDDAAEEDAHFVLAIVF
jgi:hypothetical protein